MRCRSEIGVRYGRASGRNRQCHAARCIRAARGQFIDSKRKDRRVFVVAIDNARGHTRPVCVTSGSMPAQNVQVVAAGIRAFIRA